MNKRTNNLFGKLIGLCLFAFAQTGCGSGGHHLLHLAFPPGDLYTPVATNSIAFQSEGTTVELNFVPKYKDRYEVGIFAIGDPIPASYEFSGELSVEFIQSGETISSQTITKFSSGTYAGKNMDKYSSRAFCSFDVPLQGRSMDEITVKISVLKPDQEFEKFKDQVKAWIRVSPIP